jgi:hypothetical protein
MTQYNQPGASARGIRYHALSLLLAAGPTFAQATEPVGDPGYRAYRCVVLGDSSACIKTASPPEMFVEERIEIGPYARYLMSQRGLSRDAASEQASTIGEYPVRRVVSVSTRTLSSFERYERVNGRPVTAARTEVTISATALMPPFDAATLLEAGAR